MALVCFLLKYCLLTQFVKGLQKNTLQALFPTVHIIILHWSVGWASLEIVRVGRDWEKNTKKAAWPHFCTLLRWWSPAKLLFLAGTKVQGLVFHYFSSQDYCRWPLSVCTRHLLKWLFVGPKTWLRWHWLKTRFQLMVSLRSEPRCNKKSDRSQDARWRPQNISNGPLDQ